MSALNAFTISKLARWSPKVGEGKQVLKKLKANPLEKLRQALSVYHPTRSFAEKLGQTLYTKIHADPLAKKLLDSLSGKIEEEIFDEIDPSNFVETLDDMCRRDSQQEKGREVRIIEVRPDHEDMTQEIPPFLMIVCNEQNIRTVDGYLAGKNEDIKEIGDFDF